MKKFVKKSRVALGATILAVVMASGCGSSGDFVFTNTNTNTNPPAVVPPVPAPPVAVDDAFNALGNATVNFAAANGVLANDTVNGASISAFESMGSQGGTLVLNNDGSLSYTPLFGFVGAETFTYTLSNADGDSTATITFTSTGSGFFVNNQAAPGGDGSQASPFDTLNAGLAAAGSGDTVFVFRGDGTPFAGGFTLADGVSLIGEGNGLVAAQQIEPAGTAPEIGGITLAGNNTVSGFLFTGNDDAIAASGVSNLTITNNTFQTADQHQINLEDIGGSLVVSDNTFELQDQDRGLYLDQDSTNATVQVTNNTVRLLASGDGDGGAGIYLELLGTSVVTATVSGNSVTGNGNSLPADNIQYGIYVDNYSNSSLTLTLDGNSITAVANAGIYLDTYDSATMTASGTGNAIQNAPDDPGFICLGSESGVVTLDLSALMIQNIGSVGLYLGVDRSANFTASVTGSTITNTDREGLFSEVDASTPGDTPRVHLSLIDNNFSSNTNEAVEFKANTTSTGSLTACLNITGNTFDGDNLLISSNQSGGGTSVVDVEQLGSLGALNTFLNMATLMTTGTGTINDRADGFCSAP